MLCEFQSIDDQVAALEEQRRAQIVACLTGERETYAGLLASLSESKDDPRFPHQSGTVQALVGSQISLLEQLVSTMDQRIEAVQNAEII